MMVQRLTCFVVLAVLASVGVFAQALSDGSVAYWMPTFFDTVYPTATTTQNLANIDTSSSAQFVELEEPVCYYDRISMHEYILDPETRERVKNEIFEELFRQIEEVPQNDIAIKEEIKRALRGNSYTQYMQVGYWIENGRKNPFKAGSYVECKLGCFPQFMYFGRTYTNVCISKICRAGRSPNTPRFCDPNIGNDVYIHYTTFWCTAIPLISLNCGVGAHCAQKEDGSFFCEGDKVDSGSSLSTDAS